jgi:ABC-type multidrug transport system ATPase subunit
MTDLLSVRRLNKKFGRKKVLIDFNLDLQKGQCYGLLGKNGEGKTTLSRILMGVIPPDSGEIYYKGIRLNSRHSEYKKTMALIAEDSIFYSWMRIGELLNFNSAFFPKWDFNGVKGYLKRFSLDPSLKIRNLSRGMKLKVGLICALAARPEFLILDDPTSGLDVPTRYDFLNSIINDILKSGTTILFSSHLVHEIEGMIDRMGILNRGRLILDQDFETVKRSMKRIKLGAGRQQVEELKRKEILFLSGDERRCELVAYPWNEALEILLKSTNPEYLQQEALTLEEMFIYFVCDNRAEGSICG